MVIHSTREEFLFFVCKAMALLNLFLWALSWWKTVTKMQAQFKQVEMKRIKSFFCIFFNLIFFYRAASLVKVSS